MSRNPFIVTIQGFKVETLKDLDWEWLYSAAPPTTKLFSNIQLRIVTKSSLTPVCIFFAESVTNQLYCFVLVYNDDQEMSVRRRLSEGSNGKHYLSSRHPCHHAATTIHPAERSWCSSNIYYQRETWKWLRRCDDQPHSALKCRYLEDN